MPSLGEPSLREGTRGMSLFPMGVGSGDAFAPCQFQMPGEDFKCRGGKSGVNRRQFLSSSARQRGVALLEPYSSDDTGEPSPL